MTAFRILVADDLAPEGLELLAQAGEVTVQKGMNEDALRSALAGYHALVVRSATVVTARSLELAEQLLVIGRAGIGVDNIDMAAATERGIVVMNTPEAGAVTTGEHAIALMVSLARNIPAADASMRAGEWDKKRFVGVELRGKTLGILGLGRIGRAVAECGRGLSMEIIAYDPYVQQANAPAGVRMAELEECLSEADFVTVHVPLMDATRHLLDQKRIAAMKPGARLVHAARGGIVDEQALCDALSSGHLAGAALDVFEQEPLPADSPLREAPNLVLTPHLGASTKEAKRGVSVNVGEQVALCLKKGVALNGVNVPRIAPADAAVLGPFLDLAHNLASFLTQVHEGDIQSLRLTVQGGLPQYAHHSMMVAMITGALRQRVTGAVTQVNAERIAGDLDIDVHRESAAMKRDFVNLLRIEAVIGDQRHFATGTVLGHRHGRMVEMDDYMIDAIPEPPMLVTFHRDRPGVMGRIGTLLGGFDVNISRLQLGSGGDQRPAMAILNLDRQLDGNQLVALRDLEAIERAHQVD